MKSKGMDDSFNDEPDDDLDAGEPREERPAAETFKNYITPAGLERLRAELKFLLTRERPAVTEVVAWAAGLPSTVTEARSRGEYTARLIELVPSGWPRRLWRTEDGSPEEGASLRTVIDVVAVTSPVPGSTCAS